MARREEVKPSAGDSRYVRRDSAGRFTSDQVSVGRSLSKDNDQKAKADNKGGQGDRGDSKRSR